MSHDTGAMQAELFGIKPGGCKIKLYCLQEINYGKIIFILEKPCLSLKGNERLDFRGSTEFEDLA